MDTFGLQNDQIMNKSFQNTALNGEFTPELRKESQESAIIIQD